jgi:predicted phosphohydrolase
MSHICAIESFAFHHIGFLPDHLLGRNETDGYLQYFDARCRGKPLIIDLTQSITRSKDNIDQSFRTADFCQPMRKRIAGCLADAYGDIHYTKNCKGRLQGVFTEASRKADILLICGDFTDYGLPEEASILAEDLKSHVHIPAIGVIGNHDFESGRVSEVQSILKETGLTLLNGESVEFLGVGFSWVCGFGGGFAPHMLNAWGEPIIKDFVQETINHALSLEKALARVESAKRVVLLHYSPIFSVKSSWQMGSQLQN